MCTGRAHCCGDEHQQQRQGARRRGAGPDLAATATLGCTPWLPQLRQQLLCGTAADAHMLAARRTIAG